MSKSDAFGEIVEKLKEYHVNDLRVGQVMSLVFDVLARDGADPFFVEDDDLLKAIAKYEKGE